MKNKIMVHGVLFTVILTLVAGCLGGLPVTGGPSAPCSVVVSPQAASQFIARVQAAAAVKGKTVTVTATNQEVTSLLGQYIEQAKKDSSASLIPIENPVVCFQRGKMSIFAGIQAGGAGSISGLLTVGATIKNGKAAFSVDQVEVGPFSVPQDIGALVSTLITNAVNDHLNQIFLTQIDIQDGRMSLTGQTQ